MTCCAMAWKASVTFTSALADASMKRTSYSAASAWPSCVDTWRALNRGELSAPEALLRRKVHLAGDMLLALKLHLILG